MANRLPTDKSSSTDQILDLLLDALTERQMSRRAQSLAAKPVTPAPTPAPAATQPEPAAAQPEPTPMPPRQPSPALVRPQTPPAPKPPPPRDLRPGDEGWQPPPRQPSIGMGRMIGQLLLLVALLTVIVNIPVTRYGVSLARIMPDSASLIIRDGLILKGPGPEIYRVEGDKLRWISSMDAFEHLGLTWKDVHVVDDAFLAHFEKGRPIHVLLKCAESPHIYRLENNQKRWIKDINTFLAEGHIWEDVRFVSCRYLSGLPDGLPIPEDAGAPPQP